MKLSLVNEQMGQLKIIWRFWDDKKESEREDTTIHMIDLTKKTISELNDRFAKYVHRDENVSKKIVTESSSFIVDTFI